ncbi:PREDICTED: protein NRT1/ PTR FAMILY 5.10-like, partial [Tarenaya hassleriana]|uniref:protein NRT1/ PTR FAMILY 5.10-like n=1 Tax=Tarenaya hassleriana TaxID=28532 RepID=UPI00053C76CE
MAERFANFGISSNLITYLTGPVGLSTAAAAASVNAWSGTALLLPLLGGFVADSFLGRFRTIIFSSLLYVSGLALLTYSTMVPSLASHATHLQVVLFFCALYLVAIAQGGYRPCAQAFGAGQFDEHDPRESKAKSSYFNWRFFCICAGILISRLLLNYIQDNLSWAVGYAIPCLMMLLALIIFLLGRRNYRFSGGGKQRSQFSRIGDVFVEAVKNRRIPADEEETLGILSRKTSQQFGFLNKAAFGVCSIDDVEEAKGVLRLVPIWATCLVYAIAFAQNTTLFTKQGATMDRRITSGFDIPAATLQCFISLAIVIFIPIYDRILVPVARSITRRPTGITMLQRIGTGIFLSFVTMVISALVEMKRLRTARDHGLVDRPEATIPMSVWWLVPQYF